MSQIIGCWLLGALAAGGIQDPRDELVPGLVGEYYSIGKHVEDFYDLLVLPPVRFKRVDPKIEFEQTQETFGGTKLRDFFCVRWTGFVRVPKKGRYTFSTTSNDGSRLYINGSKVVSNGGQHEMKEKSGTIKLEAGLHAIKVEFFENLGHTGCIVSWKGPGVPKQVIPESALSHRKRDTPTEREMKGIERDIEPRADDRGEKRLGAKFFGVLKQIDGRKITVAEEKGGAQARQETFTLAENAGIIINRRKGSAEDLEVGQFVGVTRRGNRAIRVVVPRASRRPAEKQEEVPTAQKPAEEKKPDVPIGDVAPDKAMLEGIDKAPDLVGRVTGVFSDGPVTLLNLRKNGGALSVFVRAGTKVEYVGLPEGEQKPARGMVACVWLKEGSKDAAAVLRLGREKAAQDK